MSDQLDRAIADQFLPDPPAKIGVAVSGGSDSMALLVLLHRFANLHAVDIHAVTVDHGLREGSDEEAAAVDAFCQTLGIKHTTLHWRGWDRTGNLQSEARRARYDLMNDWARKAGIDTIALGHTQDDQAETVLLRLARGAGVDGLTAMTPVRHAGGIIWVRPLLEQRRADLRLFLQGLGIAWTDDPSNEDTQFERVKARQALVHLEPLGVSVPQLAQVAWNMARARDALDQHTLLSARDLARVEAGALTMDWDGYRALPDEIARRLLVRALGWISGSDYAPRRASVSEMIEALHRDQAATLHGCQARRINGTLWICREYHSVRDISSPPGDLWDSRWQCHGTVPPGRTCAVRALGDDGLRLCPDWRDTTLPRDVLRCTPAIWADQELIAAPLANLAQGWHCEVIGGAESFFAALLSH